MAKLTLNDNGLTGLVGDVDVALRVMLPAIMLFAQAIFGEVSKGT